MSLPDCNLGTPHIAMGIFALYVVIVSLVRIMSEKEFFRLTGMKKVWGRSRGLAMHFISNVGVPLVLGIVFFTRGIAGFSPGESLNCASSVFSLKPPAVATSTVEQEPTASPEKTSARVDFQHHSIDGLHGLFEIPPP